MPGNQFGDKLTDEQKQEAYKQYCDWISEGKSKKSWHYKHPELSLTWQGMEMYMKKYPEAFKSSQMYAAECKGLATWEGTGKDMMLGKIEGRVQPAIFQMFMRNLYDWDKKETNVEDATKILIDIVDYAKGRSEKKEAILS